MTISLDELLSRSSLQLAYIARVHPDGEARRLSEKILADRRVLGWGRRWINLLSECAEPFLALIHGGDEDLDPGCMALSDRQIRWTGAFGLVGLSLLLVSLVIAGVQLGGAISRAALLSGLAIFFFLRRRRR